MINGIKEKLKKNRTFYKLIYRFRVFVNKFGRNIHGKNNIVNDQSIISEIKYDIIGDNNSILFKTGSRIFNLKVFIRGNNHKVVIGENCIIKSGFIWIEDDNCTLTIGNDTTIEDAHFGITESNSVIEVGEDCMFSSGIRLLTGDSHSIIDMQSMKRINYANNIKIGPHVWLGTNVVILKGVEIEKDSIVGSGSIVTKKYGPNLIIAGAPAKAIKDNITWDRERIYI
jgi:acetyltransferase-like isoleucine patch superfamily enzyme